MNYLAETARICEERHLDKRNSFLILFAASVCLVFVHAVLEIVPHSTIAETMSLIFVALGVVLPAIATGLRTKHFADELARNASRYKAKRHSLQELQERLSRAVETRDGRAVLREMSFCEQVLELDQREWLRLMIEAEWY